MRSSSRLCWLSLLLGNVDLASVNSVGDSLGALSVNLATDTEGSAQNLLHGTGQSLRERLVPHGAGNLDDLVKRNGLVVLDVLLLLAVAGGLLQRADDERRCGGNDGDGSLTVLDGELHGDAKALPVTRGLSDIFADLLGGQTKGTNLGSQRRRSANLTTGGTEVNDLDFVGIDLGSF